MPQSIWEDRQEVHPEPQYVTSFTDTWAYIGETIKVSNASNTAWVKGIVRNRLFNTWTILNDVYRAVDYSVHPEYNKITFGTLPDTGRDDITEYRLRVNTVPPTDLRFPYGTPPVYVVITAGVQANTTYTSNINAEYQMSDEPEGPDATPEWSPDSITTFTTPNNPIPTPPLNLTSPNRTNDWIDLAWNASANGQAVSYQVFSRVGVGGALTLRAATTAHTARISGLADDTQYQWWVVALGPTGLHSQPSNILRWATGHNSVSHSGSVKEEKLVPDEWGSWRKDIGWLDWHVYPGTKKNHKWVYQGYWPGPHNTGPTSPNTSQREQNGRYKGIITYDAAGFRARLNARFGYDVGGGFGRGEVNVTRVTVQRPYRQRQPGNLEAQWIKWWLAYANPYSGEPTLRESHINNKDDADHNESQKSFKAGTDRHFLRLPRAFGRALVQGWYENTGSKVNALGMYRSDNDHNGYGTAGYARFAGHLMHDDQRGYTDESSNWTILIDCSWTIQTVAYVGPYQW